MNNYITNSIPILGLGKTRTVYDIIRVTSLPEEVKKQGINLIKDEEITRQWNLRPGVDFSKPEDASCVFWLIKNPACIYRINVNFLDSAELIDFENGIDQEVYKLCDARSYVPVSFNAATIESRCHELGIYPTRIKDSLILREPINNNEARVIAKYHNMLGLYDETYAKQTTAPVINSLIALNLL